MKLLAPLALLILLTACAGPGEGTPPPVGLPDVVADTTEDTQGGDAQGADTKGADGHASDEGSADGDADDDIAEDAGRDVAHDGQPGDATQDAGPDACTPSCADLECGDDGCGGVCGECGAGAQCVGGACQALCSPACDGKACGPNGCGGLCGACGEGDACVGGQCQPVCAPACDGKACGDDGCGGVCGECGAGQQCVGGQCEGVCAPACGGKACGGDGCGGSCGACGEGQACVDGQCQALCTPACGGKQCGEDGCGGACGTCGVGEQCVAGGCEPVCVGSCADKQCGGDGCGGWCGTCGAGHQCKFGQCEPTCKPACDGKACGGDGCGGSCGTCGAGEQCVSGQCEPICAPACGGKECGGDGCGGSCGACGAGEQCVSGQCEPLCAPACGGKECGADGCGGSCGTCALGETCSSGQCECAPKCSGKECGGDGCGGSCGACAAGEQCVLGACKVPTGDLCSDALVVDSVPYSDSRSTGGTSTSHYGVPAGACPGSPGAIGQDALDRVYSFTPKVSGPYVFTLTGTFDTGLYVSTSCSNVGGACLGGVDLACVGCEEKLELDLVAGQQVMIFVDGSWHITDSGPYILKIDKGCDPTCAGWECGPDGCGGSCGACPLGEQCVYGECEASQPIPECSDAVTDVIDTWPYSHDSFIWGSGNHYSFNNCPGNLSSGGKGTDRIYEMTAPVFGQYRFTLSPHNGDVFDLYVVRDCTKINQTCLGATWMVGSVSVVLQPGEVVYAIVDGHTSSEWGDYTLKVDLCEADCSGLECGIDPVCGVSCGACAGGTTCGPTGQCVLGGQGDSCDTAFQVDTVPFVGVSSTAGMTDDFEFKDCPFFQSTVRGDGVQDHVWAFTAPAAGVYTVRLDEESGHNALVYIASDCDDVYGTCLRWHEGCSVKVASCDFLPTMELQAGETRYVVVDAYQTSPSGYRLTFDAQCQEDCAGKECGTDPCLGGSCGACPSGFACDAQGQCQPSAALVINEIDYDNPGSDTAEFVELYNAGSEPAVLADYVLESVNGTGGGLIKAVPLGDAGATLAPGAYLVVGFSPVTSALPQGVASVTVSGSFLQNGGPDGDAVRLVHATSGVVEAVSYTAPVPGANEGGTHAGTDPGEGTLSRCPNGVDTGDNGADFAQATPATPGAANGCP